MFRRQRAADFDFTQLKAGAIVLVADTKTWTKMYRSVVAEQYCSPSFMQRDEKKCLLAFRNEQ